MYLDINIYLDIVNAEMFKDLQFRRNEACNWWTNDT
jgi:hypothetical protein